MPVPRSASGIYSERIGLPPVSAVLSRIRRSLHHRRVDVKKAVVEKMLQGAFAEVLQAGELDLLEGRCMVLDIHDVNFGIAIGLQSARLVVMPESQSAEVIIRGELSGFIALAARREDLDTLFVQGRLCLEGDAELGLAVKQLMNGADLGSLPRWVQQGINIADHFQAKRDPPESRPPAG